MRAAPTGRVRRFSASLAFLLLSPLWASTALADGEDTGPQSPKRPVPNYDGRGPDPSTEDGAGTWTARVLLAPLYLTSEYLVREPIGGLMRLSERHDIPRKLYDFFAFGPDHKIGFYPVGFLQFGAFPSIGAYGFWDDAGAKHNSIRLHYEAWPADVFYASIYDRYRFTETASAQVRVTGLHRPDMPFYGLGPTSVESSQSRYAESLFDVNATFDEHYWRSSVIQGRVGLRKVDISDGHYGSDPSLTAEANTGAFGVPFGFGRDYVAPYTSLLVSFDTRKPRATRGSGVRLEVSSEQGTDAAHYSASWVRYGGAATAFIDLDDHGRILGIKAAAIFADPMAGTEPVPFTELVSIGGDKWMRGFFPGRLVDRSAAIAELSYMWPVASSLDATLQAQVGNVFGEHLQDFRPGLLRFSGAFGFASRLGDPPLELLIGFGTETIDHGTQVDSFRLTLGVPATF